MSYYKTIDEVVVTEPCIQAGEYDLGFGVYVEVTEQDEDGDVRLIIDEDDWFDANAMQNLSDMTAKIAAFQRGDAPAKKEETKDQASFEVDSDWPSHVSGQPEPFGRFDTFNYAGFTIAQSTSMPHVAKVFVSAQRNNFNARACREFASQLLKAAEVLEKSDVDRFF